MDRPAHYFASLTVPSRMESVRAVAAFVVQASRSLKVAAASHVRFEAGIVEALTNAIKHGRSAGEEASIICELELVGRSLVVRLLDGGSGFALNPSSLPGISPEDVDALPDSGYGLALIHAVFPGVRVIERGGRFGIELPLRF